MRSRMVPLLFMVLLFSCATSEAKKWKIDDVSDEKKEWDICHERKHGPEKHMKGFCYNSRECRKTFFGNKKCRPLPLFCAWGDERCYEKYGLERKKLR